MPHNTLHTATLARRALKEPPELHAHSKTQSERTFTHNPRPGMLWSITSGWQTNPERPSCMYPGN
jgi:hypothetical protein